MENPSQCLHSFHRWFLSSTNRLTFSSLSCYSSSCWVMLRDCVSAPSLFPCKIRLPTIRAEEQPRGLPGTSTVEKRSWMLAPTALYLLHLKSLGSKTRENVTFKFCKYSVLPLWLEEISNRFLLITRVGSVILLYNPIYVGIAIAKCADIYSLRNFIPFP